jgi:hypothetical protein
MLSPSMRNGNSNKWQASHIRLAPRQMSLTHCGGVTCEFHKQHLQFSTVLHTETLFSCCGWLAIPLVLLISSRKLLSLRSIAGHRRRTVSLNTYIRLILAQAKWQVRLLHFIVSLLYSERVSVLDVIVSLRIGIQGIWKWTTSEIKQTPWPLSASELYQPSDRLLLAKLVPTFAGRGCCVVSSMNPHCRIIGFIDRSRYHFFQAAPQMYLRGWVVVSGTKPGTSGSAARNSDHLTTEAVYVVLHGIYKLSSYLTGNTIQLFSIVRNSDH